MRWRWHSAVSESECDSDYTGWVSPANPKKTKARVNDRSDEIVLSRTALEDYLKCPRCFYLHRRLKLPQMRRVPLTLAIATDALLKNEFDAIRATGQAHPLWVRENLQVRAYEHPELEVWRSNFKGQRVRHPTTGATITGAVDDIWQHRDTGEIFIVDYKSTSKQETPSLEGGFGPQYQRQMEIYQWIFRQAGFDVSAIGYFLYVNACKRGTFYDETLQGIMRFETTLIAYRGDDDWVDGVIEQAVNCWRSTTLPESGPDCEICPYLSAREEIKI